MHAPPLASLRGAARIRAVAACSGRGDRCNRSGDPRRGGGFGGRRRCRHAVRSRPPPLCGAGAGGRLACRRPCRLPSAVARPKSHRYRHCTPHRGPPVRPAVALARRHARGRLVRVAGAAHPHCLRDRLVLRGDVPRVHTRSRWDGAHCERRRGGDGTARRRACGVACLRLPPATAKARWSHAATACATRRCRRPHEETAFATRRCRRPREGAACAARRLMPVSRS